MSCIYCSQGELHPLACNTAALVVPFVSGLRCSAAPEHLEFNTMTPLYVLCCDLSLDSSLFGLGAFRSGMFLPTASALASGSNSLHCRMLLFAQVFKSVRVARPDGLPA